MNFKICRSVKKYINSGKDYLINTRLNLKIRFLRQKKKRIKITEMSSSILLKCSLKSPGPAFSTSDNFACTFVNIRFMIIGQ